MSKIEGVVLSVLFLSVACGGGADSSVRSGVTECGTAVSCQAGQYCSDPRFAECSVGCLSNNNCAGDQTCVTVPGSSVGSCALPSAAPPDLGRPITPPGDLGGVQGCGDGICTDAERNSCVADCGSLGDSARSICDSYDFFQCLGPGELQACYDQVTKATVAQRQQFVNCGATAVDCKPCRQYLPQ